MRWGKSVVFASLISFGAFAQTDQGQTDQTAQEPEIIDETDQQQVEPGTGGSEEMGQQPTTQETQQPAVIGEPQAQEPTPPPEAAPPEAIAVETEEPTMEPYKGGPDLKGLTVLAGGGVEGYTDNLAGQLNPGPGWSAVADIKPFKALGLELGYSGAATEVDHDVANAAQGATSGADFIRHGGHAALVVGAPTPVQPYVLGGYGLDRYTWRGSELGRFQSDTSSTIPVAVGLRSHTGHFTADLRAGYDVLLSQDFDRAVDNNVTTGRYTGLLQFGGTF